MTIPQTPLEEYLALAGRENKDLERRLLASRIPLRLAYTALDGTPRIIPHSFEARGKRIVVACDAGAARVEAMRRNPSVAMCIDTDEPPYRLLLMRGEAQVKVVNGLPAVFTRIIKRYYGANAVSYLEQAKTRFPRMALISIDVTWRKTFAYETEFVDLEQPLDQRR